MALFWGTLSQSDKEWFTGNEWKARTQQIEQWLSSLPEGWTHEILRYEGSDFVKIHGPKGELIDFGSLTPDQLHDSEKIKFSQIGSIRRLCDMKVNNRVSLVETLIFDDNEITVNDIAKNYDKLLLIWEEQLSHCKN